MKKVLICSFFFLLLTSVCLSSKVYSQGSNSCCFIEIKFTKEFINYANEYLSYKGSWMSIKILNKYPKESAMGMTVIGTLETAAKEETLTLNGERITYYDFDDVPGKGLDLNINQPTNPIYLKLPEGEYGIAFYFRNSKGGYGGHPYVDLSGNNKLKSGVMNVVNYWFDDNSMGESIELY